jgi:hypothetical protein
VQVAVTTRRDLVGVVCRSLLQLVVISCPRFQASAEIVNGICAILGYYVSSSGNPLLTFRDNLSIPSSRR